jgi:hypothetical protein
MDRQFVQSLELARLLQRVDARLTRFWPATRDALALFPKWNAVRTLQLIEDTLQPDNTIIETPRPIKRSSRRSRFRIGS